MKLRSDCIVCILDRYAQRVDRETDEDKKAEYLREIMKTLLEAPDDISSPQSGVYLGKVYEKYFGKAPETDYSEINRSFDLLMMKEMDKIEAAVRASDEPILAAIRYSLASNYIDYSAVDVKLDELMEIMDNAAKADMDETEYGNLLKDLEHAKKVLFLHDNCGEIVIDKLLIRLIRERFPQVEVKSCVKGKQAINDATREDADLIGMSEVAEVIDTGLGIQGTPMTWVSPSLQQEFLKADVILSKGQANFETCFGCGLNIYYMFLCKCRAFVRLFNVERFSYAFLNDRHLDAFMEENGIRGEHSFVRYLREREEEAGKEE